jgi:hypothetical protein
MLRGQSSSRPHQQAVCTLQGSNQPSSASPAEHAADHVHEIIISPKLDDSEEKLAAKSGCDVTIVRQAKARYLD